MDNKRIATIAAVAAVVIIALVVYTETIRDMTAQQIEHALDRRLIERACDAFSHPCDAEEIMSEYPEDVDSCILAFPDDHRLRGFCLDNAGANVPLAVLGTTTGDNANGSAVWHEIEYNGSTAYVHSSLVVDEPITLDQAQQAQQSPAEPQSTNRSVRPRNCDHARELGLSDVEAAQWSHLDRDRDGVACYGD